jgi:hypothetical protein
VARFYEEGKSELSFRGKFYTVTFSAEGKIGPGEFFLGEILYQVHLSGGKV